MRWIRHVWTALRGQASRARMGKGCHRNNCGTACLCPPCHAREALAGLARAMEHDVPEELLEIAKQILTIEGGALCIRADADNVACVLNINVVSSQDRPGWLAYRQKALALALHNHLKNALKKGAP